jgi:hypothetical protein
MHQDICEKTCGDSGADTTEEAASKRTPLRYCYKYAAGQWMHSMKQMS